jgi:hypothetical protein
VGCPTVVDLEEDFIFSVCTHDPDTGILTDAGSPPTYRIYEEETATPILTGSMAKLDDSNTTGFYAETISPTALAGFERGKSYSIYITASVGAKEGGMTYGFKVSLAQFTTDGYIKSDQQFSTGAVVTDALNGALSFKTDLSESTSDTHKGKYLKFTSGTLINEVKKVSAYNGTTKFITVTSAFTGTPVALEEFELIDQ